MLGMQNGDKMKYTVGICDDEQATCSVLENIILNYFKALGYEIEVYVWNTGDSCCNDLEKKIQVNLLFLDIELPGKNGVETGKYIREYLKDEFTKIVYISSKTNYAMELFQVHPYDFLVKPLKEDRVNATLSKVLAMEQKDKMKFRYENNRNTYTLALGEIEYFSSNNKHIDIHLITGEIRSYRGKLKEELLKLPNQFVRVGQSDVIHLRYLKECHYDYVIVRSGERINISQKYRSSFKERLSEYNRMGGVMNG